jgi:hypothetical protein
LGLINTGGDIRFYTGGDATTNEAIRIDSNKLLYLYGGQIKFPATAVPSSDANTLDDYEEGTWTPLYTPATGAFATMTMEVVYANYVKVGKMVTVSCYIRTDSVSIGTASGYLYLGGLPFSTGCYTAGSVSWATDWGGDFPSAGYITAGAAYVDLIYRDAVDGLTIRMDVSDLATGAVADKNRLIFSVTYVSS